jgi:hypothetical protein
MPSLHVLEIVAQLRAVVGDHPFWTFAAIAIGWRLIAFGRRPAPAAVAALPAAAGTPTVAVAAAGAGAIAIYATIAIWYAVGARSYYDFAEPTVACIAWLFDRGLPIYHAVDAAERYAHMYGPLAFMMPGWFLAATAPGIIASKLAGVLTGLLSVAAVYRLMRSATTARRALALTGLFALLCLTYRNTSFWIRPDSFTLLFASLALLFATTSRRGWLAAIGVGISTGVLVNLKLTGPLYALPAFALLYTSFGGGLGRGAKLLLLALTATVVVAMTPFVAWSNVSLANYLTWVKTSAGNGLLWSLLRHNAEWTLFLLVPLASTFANTATPSAAPGAAARSRMLVSASLLVGILAVAFAAAKPGAGPYHLLPFWPAVLYLVALHAEALPAAFVIATMIVASLQQLYFIGVMRSADDAMADAAADVVTFVDANPGRTIAMGYANAGERWTYVRPAIVFRTGRYPIDAPAVQEFEMSGLAVPDATIEALRRCDTDIWLIPKGATPFDGPNKYPSMQFAPLFPETFKRLFVETYVHDAAHDTRYFDVWRCRRTPSLAGAPASLP